MRILFTGGGTGGHVFPVLALIRELRVVAEAEKIVNLEMFYMSPDNLGVDLIKKEGVTTLHIITGKWRNYFSFKNFVDSFKVVIGLFQALWNVFLIMPDVVFSKGGYGSLPAIAASIVFRLPVVIHDSDAIPGKVNLFAGKFARRIGVAFVSTAHYFPSDRTAVVGIPIRREIMGGKVEEARQKLGIDSSLSVVGFIGASQGAEKLNNALLNILRDLTDRYEVVHQTGYKNFNNVFEEAKIILDGSSNVDRYHPVAFLDEEGMRAFYAASDLIVSRASATSIYEIAASSKPAILFPLSNAAQDHQRKNAYEYARTGAAIVIEEENLRPHLILAEIDKILTSPEIMQKMSSAARKFARLDSAEIITRELLRLGTHL